MKKNNRRITLEERMLIVEGLSLGFNFRAIAQKIERDHTVISRDVSKHGGRENYHLFVEEEVKRRGTPLLLLKQDISSLKLQLEIVFDELKYIKESYVKK